MRVEASDAPAEAGARVVPSRPRQSARGPPERTGTQIASALIDALEGHLSRCRKGREEARKFLCGNGRAASAGRTPDETRGA
jgi:hypothetical protein